MERELGVGGHVLSTGEPFVTEHYLTDPRMSQEHAGIIAAEGLDGGAVLPLRFRGQVTGVLGVATRTRRVWTDADLRVLGKLADQRFHLDARRWFEPAPEHPALETVALAVWSDRALQFAYARNDGAEVAREADAIALGLKAGLWYFVGRVGGEHRVYRVSRMTEVKLAEREFARDPAFDLRAFWDAWAKRFEDGLAAIPVTVRVAPDAAEWVARLGNPALRPPADAPATPDSDGWLRRTLVFEKLDYAESALLGFGAAVEVVEPVELRERLRVRAGEIAALYAAG
jgi:predicted DNA-binding transcriptional regulator YafY